MAREPIPAPAPRPPRYGLLAAAPTVDDPDLRVLAAGWAFAPEGCGLGGITSVDCSGITDEMTPAGLTMPDTVEGDPIWIWAMDWCSTFGFNARDWQGRARRQLAATESFRLARELWTGTEHAQPAPDAAGKWLAQPGSASDQVTSAPTPIADAIGCVEAGLAEALTGQQGMIHLTPQALVAAAQQYVVERQGTVWVTPMGTIVVADAGNTGSGPGGAAGGSSQWIYGTPVLSVRLGPVEMIPGDLADARSLAQAMDRGVNDVVVIAGRLAAVQWPNECAHIAAEIDLDVCRVGGTS